MRLPKHFGQVSIEKYQKCLSIWKSDIETLDKWIGLLSTLTNKSNEEIGEIEISKLTQMIKSLSWLVNGEFYAI